MVFIDLAPWSLACRAYSEALMRGAIVKSSRSCNSGTASSMVGHVFRLRMLLDAGLIHGWARMSWASLACVLTCPERFSCAILAAYLSASPTRRDANFSHLPTMRARLLRLLRPLLVFCGKGIGACKSCSAVCPPGECCQRLAPNVFGRTTRPLIYLHSPLYLQFYFHCTICE